MAVFTSDQHLYAVFEQLVAKLRTDSPRALRNIRRARATICLHCSNPQAEIFIDGLRSPMCVTYGAKHPDAVLDVQLSADTLHAILSNQLHLSAALVQNKVHLNGSRLRAMTLRTLFEAGRFHYPTIARAAGLPQSNLQAED